MSVSDATAVKNNIARITKYPSCHIFSNKILPSNDQTIINTTNIIPARAFTTVSLSPVFIISTETRTFFTTFQSQYKNQTREIIIAKLIPFEKPK